VKICPKCGYEEHISWRSRSNRAFCSYIKWEQFKELEPDGAAKLVEIYPHPVSDGHFNYHITKTGLNVERIELELYKVMGWGAELQEKHTRSRLWELAPIPNKRKLRS